ncbi:hypothetical protein C8J56DRAFT_889672 [Mycena floridula]|nr:hypothetical protein C8J56DRAFT_889672 [Mycena floridula]
MTLLMLDSKLYHLSASLWNDDSVSHILGTDPSSDLRLDPSQSQPKHWNFFSNQSFVVSGTQSSTGTSSVLPSSLPVGTSPSTSSPFIETTNRPKNTAAIIGAIVGVLLLVTLFTGALHWFGVDVTDNLHFHWWEASDTEPIAPLTGVDFLELGARINSLAHGHVDIYTSAGPPPTHPVSTRLSVITSIYAASSTSASISAHVCHLAHCAEVS